MLHALLKFAHIAGLMLIAAGLIGVFLADIRTRQARTLPVNHGNEQPIDTDNRRLSCWLKCSEPVEFCLAGEAESSPAGVQ